MRVTVTNAGSVVVAQGPGAYLIRNVTGTATLYLEGEDPASEAAGFAWLASDPPLEIDLAAARTLNGLVASGGAAQTLHVLRGRGPAFE